MPTEVHPASGNHETHLMGGGVFEASCNVTKDLFSVATIFFSSILEN